jgi:hypothetical protein
MDRVSLKYLTWGRHRLSQLAVKTPPGRPCHWICAVAVLKKPHGLPTKGNRHRLHQPSAHIAPCRPLLLCIQGLPGFFRRRSLRQLF